MSEEAVKPSHPKYCSSLDSETMAEHPPRKRILSRDYFEKKPNKLSQGKIEDLIEDYINAAFYDCREKSFQKHFARLGSLCKNYVLRHSVYLYRPVVQRGDDKSEEKIC